MRTRDGRLTFSAGDLAGHLACGHLSDLDRRAARGELERPVRKDPVLELLQERGLEFERAYVDHLRAQGREVVELRDVEGGTALERTREACRRGVDVIVQAELGSGRWHGRADLLVRAEGESDLGAWRYEVIDTKLARDTRAGTVLQLCLYADLLAEIQGSPAERMWVVKPGSDVGAGPFEREPFTFVEYQAYYRFVRARLEAFADGDDPAPYPAPVSHCDVCAWWSRCDRRRHDDDHLSLVAGLSTLHTAELERQGHGSLTAFAEAAELLREPPRRGHRDTYRRLQRQAAVQLLGRQEGRNVTELLPVDRGRGLTRLPEPDPGDVFLDFEGDSFAGEGGLEYLTGWAWFDDRGELDYRALWATDRAAEKRALAEFVDFLTERLERHPGLHVYHYTPYEPAALKRLVSRHATREDELDVLLRAERFVDLHAVLRGGLIASVESYSLKPMEAFFGYEREVRLREEASPALRRVALALEGGTPEAILDPDRATVEGYNRDDCLSLVKLRDWLEERRVEAGITERPELVDGAPSQQASEKSAEVQAVFDALVAGIPEEPDERDEQQRARWLLAHLLEYFHREDKVSWWEYHARRAADDEALFRDRKALVGVTFEGEVEGGTKACPFHEYGFPPQEASFKPGDDVRDLRLEAETRVDGEKPKIKDRLGTVQSFDAKAGTLVVKKTKLLRDHHPDTVHVQDRVPPRPLDGALLDLARWVNEPGHVMDAASPELRAARDLLLRRPPRRADPSAPLRQQDETSVAAAARIVGALDGGLLAVQGPPGTGKTYSGSRVILELLKDKRIGVTATSHRVIRNLLDSILDAGAEAGEPVEAAHKPSSRDPRPPEPRAGLSFPKNAEAALEALDEGKVVGGVAWLWAGEAMANSLDYLFVDEAGQMSLAHVLACARATRNLVLLGDPQQLQQPQRGAHPEGAEISALSHLLDGRDTIPDHQGLFLDTTWRLPPAICGFTSELYYDGRLEPREACRLRELDGPPPITGAGLFLVPVEHEANQSGSPEEVEAVAALVAALTDGRTRWRDDSGSVHPLTTDHLLVIAPYNVQVAALKRRLGDAIRVGTVDKFQGQQAPVVLYSMTSSSAADAPRGMAFLYDPHRLNVATSRAQCACVLVASPKVFEPDCRTPDQMRWANGLVRYRELATTVDLGELGTHGRGSG